MEKAFSDALKMRLTSDIFSSKKLDSKLSSWIILLFKAGDLSSRGAKGADFSRFAVLR